MAAALRPSAIVGTATGTATVVIVFLRRQKKCKDKRAARRMTEKKKTATIRVPGLWDLELKLMILILK